MNHQNMQCNPEKYKITSLLAVTSIIGVLFMFVGIYNASRDLERIHKVDSLYNIALATLGRSNITNESVNQYKNLFTDDYQLQILENGIVTYASNPRPHNMFPNKITELEQSRVNLHGGYIEVENDIYAWAMLPEIGTDRKVILIHNYNKTPLWVFIKTYSKRLLIPAIFYIWLMVWIGLIIRFFTNKLKEQNEMLGRMAMHDSLTGLANRTLLEDRLAKLIQDCQRNKRIFALAVIDLDKFKEINDTLGHEQGDKLLCHFSNRVKSILRAADTFSRIGGDEFVLLLNGADKKSCIKMCERIMTIAAEPYRLKEAEVNIGLSIGIAIFPIDGEESTTLIRNADKAMYSIKSSGGGIKICNRQQKNIDTALHVTIDKSTNA